MTVVVTRDVEDRYRGFLLSCMPEIAPGVYAAAAMNQGIRSRMWHVVREWHAELQRGSVTLIYSDKSSPSGLKIEVVGTPAKELVDFDGFYVSLRRK